MRRRVAITGLGCVSALGVGVEKFWQSVTAGESGIGPVTLLPRAKLNVAIAAEANDYDSSDYFEPKKCALLDRFAQFAIVAAREALGDSGLDPSRDGLAARTAIVLGSGVGGKTTDDEAFYKLYGEGQPRVSPTVIPRVMGSSAASQVSIDLSLTGPGFTVSSACAAANHAIGQAAMLVQHGVADAALAGGSEACITLGTWKAWEALRVLSPEPCSPFSLGRRGMTLGEGAGFLMLEPLDAAQARGVRIYAELAGCGMSSDAGHIVDPSQAGAARAIQAALADASIAPEQVGYVNAHGTGTKLNDLIETRAIRQVFGSHADRLAVSASKSMHGHALGASGALEAIACALAIHDGVLPPTANFGDPDPECDLDYLQEGARQVQVEAALSNSFAFGGLNAVLAFRQAN